MNQESTATALTKDWYAKIEEQASANFINLPIEFQLKGYDYNFIATSYLNFFKGNGDRSDKLTLAKKFLKFIKNINKNRAKVELGEEFFKCFEYFMKNFPDLLAKPDMIHLETLSIITDAIDKSAFIEDVINIDELVKRIKKLDVIQQKEQVIEAEWIEIEEEYNTLNKNNLLEEKFIEKAENSESFKIGKTVEKEKENNESAINFENFGAEFAFNS